MQAPPADRPLLRAPSFPWVAETVAAVSRIATAPDSVDEGRLTNLIDLVREARVGGSFWAAPGPPLKSGSLILRPRDAAHAETLLGHAPRIGGPAIALLPQAGWARAVGAHCRQAGIAIHGGEVDPWSMLAPGVRLLADARDEWIALANLAGAEPIGHDAAALRARLGHALLERVAYRDCFAGEAATAEEAVAILAGWRRTLDANRGIAAATGMAWWKRDAIRHFLWSPRARPLPFTKSAKAAVAAAQEAGDGGIAVWPSRAPLGFTEAATAAGLSIVAVEDGFIRSVGLGADLLPPASIVVDRGGVYYDPATPSDLETLLQNTLFAPSLIARAERIAALIVARGISKYDAGGASLPSTPRDRRTVLVAGQVEDDASVATGGAGIAGNLDLLARARAAEPHALLLFKPHPDVDAGHRQGRVPDADLLAHADAIVRGEPMAAVLARVDAVHVLTSLTGFEALLRGLEVVTHGRPFYAGWGLTRDLAGPIARRTRRLTLAQLVAGALILYPRYLDPVTALPCPPEILLDRFAVGWRPKRRLVVRARQLQGKLARLFGTTTG